MQDSQTIFTVFYGVLYGSMLSSSQGLRLFPWGLLAEKTCSQRKILIRRLFISIIIFNLIPFFLFSIIYKQLSLICSEQLSFLVVIIIGISSLSIFSIYRFWHFLMIYFKDKQYIYSCYEYEDIVKKRGIRESGTSHFIATLFYILCFLIIYLI